MFSTETSLLEFLKQFSLNSKLYDVNEETLSFSVKTAKSRMLLKCLLLTLIIKT